jgi:hypothetical protein
MVYDSLPIMPAERKRCPVLDGFWDNSQFMHGYIDACTIRMVFNKSMTPISLSCSALSAIMDRYLPPEFLFDAQLDIPSTLAANMATFQGAPLPRDLLQRWMRYAGPRQEPPGRIPVIWVAEFVELTIWGRDLEGEGQAAIEAQARAAASGGAGSSGYATPRLSRPLEGKKNMLR